MEKYQDLIEVCDKNVWLRDEEDYPKWDYKYTFTDVANANELMPYMEHGNWAIRQGFVMNDLAFVQQVNGGDEYLTLKKEDGKWKSFESISLEGILEEDGEEKFEECINKLENTTIDEYWKRDKKLIILKIEGSKEPFAKEITKGLKHMQAEVDGLIQPVYLSDGAVLICDEEGLLKGKPQSAYIEGHLIHGDFFILSDGDEEFHSVTDEQIETYSELFKMENALGGIDFINL